MSDRELLELAARAAGFRRMQDLDDVPYVSESEGGQDDFVAWNPLTDDGDALRLAVKLNMEVLRSKINDPCPWVSAVIQNTTMHGAENIGDDPYAATRRAIVRAAAEIGRQMEVQS